MGCRDILEANGVRIDRGFGKIEVEDLRVKVSFVCTLGASEDQTNKSYYRSVFTQKMRAVTKSDQT